VQLACWYGYPDEEVRARYTGRLSGQTSWHEWP
jgi:hypothetical protein